VDSLKMLVLANPRSGGGRVFRRLRKIERWFGLTQHDVTIQIPHGQKETIQYAANAGENGFDAVIAMGGDGTVKDVIQAITGKGVKLGVIPGGRGNDIARNLGYQGNLEDIIRGFAKPRVRTMDIPTVNGRYFGNNAGVGFDSAVVELSTDGTCKLPGTLCYFWNVYRAVLRFKPIPMKVTVDNEVFEGRYTLCTVCNGQDFGGGMKMAPGAEIDDGILDVVLAEDISALRLMTIFPLVYKGKHIELPEVTMHRGRRVLIEADPPSPINYDGDLIGTTPALVEVGKFHLEALVPSPPAVD